MAQIKKIEFGDGSQVTITDWGDYPLWSRICVGANTFGTDQAFFQYQSGQAAPGVVAVIVSKDEFDRLSRIEDIYWSEKAANAEREGYIGESESLKALDRSARAET